MHCRRCHGMMVQDRPLDESGRAGQPMLRCISCGDIIDLVILLNRMRWPQEKRKHYLRRLIFRPTRTT